VIRWRQDRAGQLRKGLLFSLVIKARFVSGWEATAGCDLHQSSYSAKSRKAPEAPRSKAVVEKQPAAQQRTRWSKLLRHYSKWPARERCRKCPRAVRRSRRHGRRPSGRLTDGDRSLTVGAARLLGTTMSDPVHPGADSTQQEGPPCSLLDYLVLSVKCSPLVWITARSTDLAETTDTRKGVVHTPSHSPPASFGAPRPRLRAARGPRGAPLSGGGRGRWSLSWNRAV
jgi:hypothetical protein